MKMTKTRQDGQDFDRNMKSNDKEENAGENGSQRGGRESSGVSIYGPGTSAVLQEQKRRSVDASIVNLFDRMSLAFSGKVMVSPRPKFFRGTKLTWNEKLRLNNAVWRSWNIQFIQKRKPVLGRFANPLTEQLTEQHHTRPQTQVLDGLYWKQKLDSVVKQYRKWRLFFSKGEQYQADIEEDPHDPDEVAGSVHQQKLRIPYPPPSPMPASYLANEDMPLKDSTDTFFTSLRKKRFSFPDPKEIAKGASNADIIQPGLLQLQPDMEDLMDTSDIIQELLDDSRSSFTNFFSMVDDMGFKQEAQVLENDALEGLLSMQSSEHVPSSNGDYKMQMNPPPFDYPSSTQMGGDPRFAYSVVGGAPQPGAGGGFVQTPAMELVGGGGGCLSYSTVQGVAVSSSSQQPQTPPASSSWDLLSHQFQQQASSAQTTSLSFSPTTTSASILGPPPPSRNFILPLLNLGAMQHQPVFTPPPPVVASSSGFVAPHTTPTTLQGGHYSPHISPYNTAPSTPTPNSTPSGTPTFTTPATSPSFRRKQSLESSEGGGPHRPRSRSRRRRRDEADQHPADGAAAMATNQTTYTQPSPRGSQVEISYGPVDMVTINEQLFTSLKYKGSGRGMSNSQERPVSGSTTPVASGSGQVSAVSSSPSSPGNGSETFEGGSSLETFEFPVYNSKRRRNSIDDENKAEKRKARHRNCEIKRRSMLQSQLDELQNFLPGLNNPDVENKVTLATLLSKAGDHIQQLSKEIEDQTEEALKLKKEIGELNEDIGNVQDELPDSGVDIVSTPLSDGTTLQQMFDEHIKNMTVESWKYWIFSLIFQPQFTTFKNITKEASDEDFCKKVNEWLNHSCTLKTLRKGVLPAMRQISTRTSILTEPSVLPQQALQQVFNIKTEKVL